MKNVARIVSRMLLRKGWPRTRGRIVGIPLDDDVEVARDQWGIPHITARSMRDLFTAQGWVHAQDRLWQMETLRRVSEGTLSEIAGSQTVAVDWLCRMVGMPDMRRRVMEGIPDEEHSHCQAYADGVNACVRHMGRRLPLEFSSMKFFPAPWSAADCASCLPYVSFTQMFGPWADKLLAVTSAGRLTEEEWNDMFPVHPGAKLPHDLWFDRAPGLKFGALHPGALSFHLGLAGFHAAPELTRSLLAAAQPGAGSNSWAVAHGKDGLPILANDPHMGVSLPAVWYFCHLRIPGVLNAAGTSLAGSPGVVIGRTERVAWGLTNFELDALDILTYRVDPDDPLLYSTEKGMLRMREEQAVIRLPGGRTASLPLFRTEKGPVITTLEKGVNAAAVLKWYGTIPDGALSDRSLRGVFAFLKAGNVSELLEAARNWKYISMNFVAADIDGHIGWHVSGAAPERKGYSGRLPGDASEGADWNGFLPSEEMPHLRDPAEGYLATANYRPEQRPESPVLSHSWCPPYRYRRIVSAIRAMNRPGVKDFQALQMDVHSGQADQILSALQGLAFDDSRAREAAAMLSSWDRKVRADSAPAAIFEVFRTELVRCLLSEKLGGNVDMYFNSISYTVENEILLRPESPLWKGNMQRMLEAALAATIDFCARRMGADRWNWSWGRLHRYMFHHPGATDRLRAWLLDPPRFPAHGDCNTLNVSWSFPGDGSYDVHTIPSMRMIASLGDSDGMLISGPLGQSGQPGHRHYNDLTEIWRKGELVRIPLTEEGVRRAAREKLVLARK